MLADPHRWTVIEDRPSNAVVQSWRSFLDTVPAACAYDSPGFFDEPFWRSRYPFALLAWRNDVVIGVATGLGERDQITCGAPFRPQFLTAPGDPDAEHLLIQGLRAYSRGRRLLTVYCWRGLASGVPSGFRACQADGCIVLDLRAGPESIFRQLSENRRRNIRAALRNGIVVGEITSPSDLREYFAIYQQWHRTTRKQITTTPKDWVSFAAMYQQRHLRRLFVARLGDRIIAGVTLRYFPGGMLEFAASSALDEFLRFRPNDILQWHVIEWGCKNGFSHYSLGSTEDFQRRFGGSVTPIVRYRLDNTVLRYYRFRDTLEDVANYARRLVKAVRVG